MRTRIIAEVAQGYEGKADYCELYLEAAAKAKADVVKFQVVYADDLSEPGYEYYELYKTLELAPSLWQTLRDQASKLGIDFVVDIFGPQSLSVARDIRPDGIKLHASDFFNRDLLQEAFVIAKLVFVSLGGVDAAETDALVEEVDRRGNSDRLVLLTGFQAEPTPIHKSNLRRLATLRQRYPGIQIGFLDHTDGASDDKVHLSLIAMALGADWIEKHLTLSRYLEIEDYVSALEPAEFANYIETLRRLDGAFGDGGLQLSEEERHYRDKSVKKLLTARDLRAGHCLEASDLLLARSGRIAEFQGFHDPSDVIGRKIQQDLKSREPILADHVGE